MTSVGMNKQSVCLRLHVIERLANYYGVAYGELRKLYYDDLLDNDPRERQMILEWAKSKE